MSGPVLCCVCVFSSHPFWTSSSLDVPAGATQEEGHTGFLIHLPSAVHELVPLPTFIENNCSFSRSCSTHAMQVKI